MATGCNRGSSCSSALRATCWCALGLLTLSGSGCSLLNTFFNIGGFPIAAFPAPELGCNKRVEITNPEGRLVDKDGNLLLLRKHFGFPGKHNRIDAEFLPIRGGVSTIEDRQVLASVWIGTLWPFPTMQILPRVNVCLIPFVDGHHGFIELRGKHRRALSRYYMYGPSKSPKRLRNTTALPVTDSITDPVSALCYWQVAQDTIDRAVQSGDIKTGEAATTEAIERVADELDRWRRESEKRGPPPLDTEPEIDGVPEA
ncbi:MAG: hypothetical protein GY842_28525 [bacterium]|nr:hypothetical protein [bacterium]